MHDYKENSRTFDELEAKINVCYEELIAHVIHTRDNTRPNVLRNVVIESASHKKQVDGCAQ